MIRNKTRFISAFLILLFLIGGITIFANELYLENLEINVFINPDGSARVTELRSAEINQGTENFIVIENLGKSKIKDFVVYENGQAYQYIDKWDLDASQEEKSGKNSIISTSTGYELSWGIGEYGRHDYTLEYTITDFVKELTDAQMVFWKFVNPDTNLPPQRLRILVESDYDFSETDEMIWGFGFEGEIYFQDGRVAASSSAPLARDHYATLLLKLPQGMFATEDKYNKTFEEVREAAFVDSDYSIDDKSSGSVFGFLSAFGPLLAVGALIFMLIFSNKSKLINKKPDKFRRKYKEEYYRDQPYRGDFLDIYYIPYLMGTSSFEDLLTGFILKWIKEGKIITVEEEKGWIFKKDETNIKFLQTDMPSSSLEGKLFYMMLQAAGENEILEEREFTKWAKANVSKLDSWEKSVKEDSIKKLEKAGYITIVKKKVLFFTSEKLEISEKGKELESRIYKYINYLNDFSLLNENEAINVTLWDNIMIWAGFLGLTEVVSKQFEQLYPRYNQETVYTGNTIFLTHHLARNIQKTKVSSSRSSGGGGSTSMGGGGGSFGGGSGGGVR